MIPARPPRFLTAWRGCVHLPAALVALDGKLPPYVEMMGGWYRRASGTAPDGYVTYLRTDTDLAEAVMGRLASA
jgi:hypothetical protein